MDINFMITISHNRAFMIMMFHEYNIPRWCLRDHDVSWPQVTESGWGEFEIGISLFFQASSAHQTYEAVSQLLPVMKIHELLSTLIFVDTISAEDFSWLASFSGARFFYYLWYSSWHAVLMIFYDHYRRALANNKLSFITSVQLSLPLMNICDRWCRFPVCFMYCSWVSTFHLLFMIITLSCCAHKFSWPLQADLGT